MRETRTNQPNRAAVGQFRENQNWGDVGTAVTAESGPRASISHRETFVSHRPPPLDSSAAQDAWARCAGAAGVHVKVPRGARYEARCAVSRTLRHDREKATVKVRLGFDKLDPRILPDMSVKVAFQSAGEVKAAGGAAVSWPPKCFLPFRTSVSECWIGH